MSSYYDIASALAEIEKKVKAGRGQGSGADYLPWDFVQELHSLGRNNRPPGLSTGRAHQFASDEKYHYFLMLDMSLKVSDIREGYPHTDLKEMVEIAESMGIQYPTEPDSRIPKVLLTDYLVDIEKESITCYEAHLFRHVHELDSQSTLNVMDILGKYWQRREIPLKIGTPLEIPKKFVKNLEQMRKNYHLDDQDLSDDEIQTISHILTEEALNSSRALSKTCTALDKRLGLRPGSSLSVAFHLIARRIWQVDIFQPIDPAKPLQIPQSKPKE